MENFFFASGLYPMRPWVGRSCPGPLLQGGGRQANPSGGAVKPLRRGKERGGPLCFRGAQRKRFVLPRRLFPWLASRRFASARARPRLLYQIMFEMRAVRSRHLSSFVFLRRFAVFYFLRRFAGFIWTLRPGRFALVFIWACVVSSRRERMVSRRERMVSDRRCSFFSETRLPLDARREGARSTWRGLRRAAVGRRRGHQPLGI